MCLFNQSGGEEEKGPEPEPVREYTPAGRALKTRFAKLRARQKERLAKRGAVIESHPVEGLAGTESLMHSPAIAKGGDLGAGPVHSVQEGTSVNTEDNRYAQLSETQNSNADSLSRIDKLSKHKSNHFDVSVNNPGRSLADLLPPNHHNKGGININSTPTNNFAPVLGLCAPNANQIESSESNISKLNWRQNRHGARQEFPFSLAPCSGTSMDAEVRNKEIAANTKLSDTLTENLQQSFKNSIPDNNILPFVPFPFSVQGKESDAFDNSGARFSTFQEKMTLPNLPFDERLMARFPHTTKNIPNSHLDLLPNLSLGSRLEALNGSMQDLPTLPALPNFKIPPEDLFRYNQKDRDVPPTLGLGQRPTTFSSFPENHRKVLENIMMRTGSGSSSLLKKKSKSDVWSEDELDSLWIGVRRHGRGNWDGMLRDPKLNFSKYKTSEDLSVRWEEEQVKIFQGPPFSVQRSSSKTSKSTKAANFPISDGMMERALQGSKFLLPPKFHNHMTDMKLGIGDSPSSLPHFRTMDQPSLQNNHFGSFPSWRYDVNRARFPEDASAQTSERPGTSSNVPTERPFLPNSFGSSSLSAIGLNCSGNIGLQQKEEDPRNKRGKLPVLLDGLPNNMRNNRINVGSGESTSSGLLSNPIKPDFVNSKGEEIAGSSSSKDKLPHWLREAVSSPPKLPDPELPPTVSAIAQSVRMLYGDDKPAIPPFVVPGPPPSLPKDPRCSIKKKKKRSHKPKQNIPDFAGTSKDFQNSHHVDNGASSSALLPPPFPLLPQAGTPGPQQMESDLNLPPLNLKVPNLSYSSVQSKKSNFGLSPSPEVLQLVASCVAPGPHISSIPGSSSFLEGELPLPRPVGIAKFKDSEGAFRNRKPREVSPEVRCSPQEHKVEQDPDSGDSSKTQSDPSRVERPGKGESSSEGTVSDNSARDQET